MKYPCCSDQGAKSGTWVTKFLTAIFSTIINKIAETLL